MARIVPSAVLALLVVLVGTPSHAQRAAARDSACVTVVNETGRVAIRGARVRSAEAPDGGPVVFSDAAGRACLAGRDSTAVRVDALGFAPVSIALGTSTAPPVRMSPLFGDVMDETWARAQVVSALSAAARRPEVQRDTDAVTVSTDVLRRAESAPLQVALTRDSSANVVLAYVDLTPDGSRTGDVRMRFTGRDAIVLGVTTTRCGETCQREFDVALSWVSDSTAGWQPEQLVRMDSAGQVTRVALDPALAEVEAAVMKPSTRVAVMVRGVVRDEKGRPVSGIEVYSADGSGAVETSATGEYRLSLALPPGGALVTTRRVGWAPQFRTVTAEEGRAITWNPVLKSTTVLAKQLVVATGVPDILRSFRYEGFLARRARGVGQFFMTEEIWSAVSLGDMLNRARGFRAKFSYGNRLTSITVPSCGLNQSVAVYVDGNNETNIAEFRINAPGLSPLQQNENQNTAENILARYVNSAIVGMELYRGIERPPEFADPRYCAVIALWTR